MGFRIDKTQALTLFCHARQAERSIDFALHGTQQWAKLLAYYGPPKRQRIKDCLAKLRREAPAHLPVARRESFQRVGPLGLVLLPIRLAGNRVRTRWTLRAGELSFLIATLQCLVDLLEEEVRPTTDRLIELRTDLQTCQDILRWRMFGVPELKRAADIEHFCQASHVRSVTLEEMGVA